MTRAFPAGYRHPQPRSAWSGQLLLAVLLVVGLLAYLGWTAGVR
jgi:hypothetical protein